MGLFGFGRKRAKQRAEEDLEDQKDQSKELDKSEGAEKSDQTSQTSQEDRDETVAEQDEAEQSGKGPWDSTDPEAPDTDEYLDIGALMLPFLEGSELRLKANSQTGDVLGATITYKSSSLELEPFAAPKSLGLWDEVRADLLKANPSCKEVDGVFGKELTLPVKVKGKNLLTRVVGIDGPRWMLRGIFSGPAAKGGKEKDVLDGYLADLVVVRGDEPLAPRDLVPMHAPVTPNQRRGEAEDAKSKDDQSAQIPGKPEGPFDSDQQTEVKTTLSRGPMFSEVR
ncbi:DUF3710 domain-containing protein [Bifidobacterium sp. W8116]|uniref:DUF3710 domain-containing protein n=1 Tax=Bifidobacterium choladohabitans TaxID=2750947 RepID=A0ABS0R0M1_9BIFI|nr:DUF3710 domain-containing protein [Bifidobacterium choladohabitans]MBI0143954.1 DUF3710 domain-containing protein [Bifidobacterium choladohabitans]